MQRLVQPLGLSSVGLMLLSAPLQCVIAAIGAAVLESGAVAAAASAGEFTALAWSLVFLNGALAVVVNLVRFVFVKVASAVAVAAPAAIAAVAAAVAAVVVVVAVVNVAVVIAVDITVAISREFVRTRRPIVYMTDATCPIVMRGCHDWSFQSSSSP